MLMTHTLRTLHDGILVGIGTVLNDNPQLNARLLSQPPTVAQLPRPVVPSLDWQTILKHVHAAGLRRLMVEGGAAVIDSLMQQPQHIDALLVTIAPVTVGPQGFGFSSPLPDVDATDEQAGWTEGSRLFIIGSAFGGDAVEAARTCAPADSSKPDERGQQNSRTELDKARMCSDQTIAEQRFKPLADSCIYSSAKPGTTGREAAHADCGWIHAYCIVRRPRRRSRYERAIHTLSERSKSSGWLCKRHDLRICTHIPHPTGSRASQALRKRRDSRGKLFRSMHRRPSFPGEIPSGDSVLRLSTDGYCDRRDSSTHVRCNQNNSSRAGLQACMHVCMHTAPTELIPGARCASWSQFRDHDRIRKPCTRHHDKVLQAQPELQATQWPTLARWQQATHHTPSRNHRTA
ncbi:hypothetical protein L1887_47815 [Cichorium endivia]|nr:hypothetical protein L1887_47815 [Cichorium endivia]